MHGKETRGALEALRVQCTVGYMLNSPHTVHAPAAYVKQAHTNTLCMVSTLPWVSS